MGTTSHLCLLIAFNHEDQHGRTIMYIHHQQKLRLALGVARVLGATDGPPKDSREAHALGESRAWLLDEDDRLEARCLAAEIADLAHAEAKRNGAVRLLIDHASFANHIDEDGVLEVAFLLAGFWNRNEADPMRVASWGDHPEVGIATTGVATVSAPDGQIWTQREFVSEDA